MTDAALVVADRVQQASVEPRTDWRVLLRFLTCGSVDDGKSTLIGRLLYEQSLIFNDQLAALRRDSTVYGTDGDNIDFALLVDGLEAEREQGITIDVAYRYFRTAKRSFIVADTPGHEQYTRNMATGASNADLAVILVDARKGLLIQTFRHATIASLLGIRHIVLAVNKMDLVGFDQSIFRSITTAFERFAANLSFKSIVAIPISARHGDNVTSRSERMPWHEGPHVLGHLEHVDVEDERMGRPFRMAVQWVNRPNLDFRGYAGTIASGRVAVGDEILVASSGRGTRVKRIVTADGDLDSAAAGQAVTLTFADELDVARGDLLASARERPQVGDQFAAHLIWMSEERLLPGRRYLMKIGARTVPAAVTELKHRLDVTTLAKHAAKTLAMNEVGFCNLAVVAPVAFDPYADNRATGAFILIDRFSNATVAAGLISFALRRATNIHWQGLAVTKEARAKLKHHRPAILWFTGLSGAGKSTIANLVDSQLHSRGVHTVMLDGDNVRHGLNKDLGFTDADRVENIRRIGEVAKLMTEAGLVVLCSFISPFRAERRMVRELVEPGEFIEVFVDTPLDQCIARDPKGLYKRALAGELRNFTGVDQVYEVPEGAEIHLEAGLQRPDTLAQAVMDELAKRGIFDIH
jgi:bifunctional enzyme CysN/CysC